MEGLNLTPILIGLGALLAGWVIGFFDSNNRAARKIRQAEQRAEAAERKADAPPAAPGAPSRNEPSADDAGLLRLKHEHGRPVMDLDGERVQRSGLTQPQRKRLIELLTVIRPWLETASVRDPAPAAIMEMPARPVFIPAAPAGPAPATAAPTREAPAAALTMVEQIDQILQARLENTPLAPKGIRLQESPEGGVVVQVGLQRYGSVEDVADDQIRGAIRAAIAEWESKFTPRL